MVDALRLSWRSLKDFFDEFGFLVLLNLLWVLCVLLVIVPIWSLRSASLLILVPVSLVLALPLPIVSGGLCFVANQVTRGVAVNWATWGAGVRRYWKKSLLVALINGAVLLLIGTNLRFYGVVLQGAWTNFALSVWLVVGLYWLLAQIYWFPMILELESERVLLALRNALMMVVITPGFSLSMGMILVVLSAVSILLTVPALFVLAPLVMLISNHATRSRLARIQKKPYTPGVPPP